MANCCVGCSPCCEDDYQYIEEIISSLDLNEKYKLFLRNRYLREIQKYEKNANRNLQLSNSLRFGIGFGTVLTPIVLSLQSMFNEYGNLIYWIVLGLSTITGILNMTIELFKFRDNFIINKLALETMRSEGWEFFQLTGDYKSFNTNRDAYEKFAGEIEKIKKKTIKKSFALLKNKMKKNNNDDNTKSNSAELITENIQEYTNEIANNFEAVVQNNFNDQEANNI